VTGKVVVKYVEVGWRPAPYTRVGELVRNFVRECEASGDVLGLQNR